MSETFEAKIERVAAALHTPAGESPKFSSLDAIRKHRGEFVLECHKTWKTWHQEAVYQLLVFDAFAQREQTNPIGRATAEFADYNRALWRKVNDAIVWSIFGSRRDVVKRFCLYRPRSNLAESNAAAAMGAVSTLNANPMSIALWTDATSCVDVGDVIFVEDGTEPHPLFIELKEGQVNAEILDLLELTGADLDAKFRAFAEKYEKSGVKQFHRVLRQKRTADQVFELLETDRGTDPITGLEMEVFGANVDEATYDDVLDALLLKALEQPAEAMELVADCLWIYVNSDREVGRDDAARRFQQLLLDRGVRDLRASSERRRADDKDRIISLHWNVFQPMAKPIFLRNLDARAIASATCGDLMFKTFLYLDIERFAQLVAETGARFRWGSEKDTRRAQSMRSEMRPAIFAGRVPEVHVGPVKTFISDPSLVQMCFDGIHPRTIIAKMVATAEHIQRSSERAPDPAAGEPSSK